uniref:Frenatin-2.1D n=1 Tax=Discoglossus sardus TaxID=191474 RepID=FRE21_DISSA|nr:RecName: Full=Frenatin-2.1D [Discoglossus sardus]
GTLGNLPAPFPG